MIQESAVSVQILDTKSRKSWAKILIESPVLDLHIVDWFHLCTFDQEYIAVDYGFTVQSRGLASDEQLIEILSRISDLVIECFFFKGASGLIIDRFCELDTDLYYKA